ncbi:hypothetical protein TWF694_007606 [Orbilia ellipsospora]|uniref:Uncharacterized protein n=1 Tax=Orbilia ellipsospora TaxID=2528407 RepID=A0AAV9XJR4_9PEZI
MDHNGLHQRRPERQQDPEQRLRQAQNDVPQPNPERPRPAAARNIALTPEFYTILAIAYPIIYFFILMYQNQTCSEVPPKLWVAILRLIIGPPLLALFIVGFSYGTIMELTLGIGFNINSVWTKWARIPLMLYASQPAYVMFFAFILVKLTPDNPDDLAFLKWWFSMMPWSLRLYFGGTAAFAVYLFGWNMGPGLVQSIRRRWSQS